MFHKLPTLPLFPLSSRRYTLSVTALALAPLLQGIETYLFSDWQFLKFLLVLIGLDTLLGLVWAWKAGQVSSRTFSRLVTKLMVYTGFLVMIHVLCHFTIEGVRSQMFAWLSSMAYGAILIREGISILENLVRISPGILPATLVSKLKAMDEQGKITDESTPNLQ